MTQFTMAFLMWLGRLELFTMIIAGQLEELTPMRREEGPGS